MSNSRSMAHLHTGREHCGIPFHPSRENRLPLPVDHSSRSMPGEPLATTGRSSEVISHHEPVPCSHTLRTALRIDSLSIRSLSPPLPLLPAETSTLISIVYGRLWSVVAIVIRTPVYEGGHGL
jgi:hypothetical protein